jgi:hypothetical protein
MDPSTEQVVAMWRAGEDWEKKKERMAERERRKAIREAAKAAAAKKEREEEDHGVEEEVKLAFASQDLRGQYGGQGIGLPIVRLPKNYLRKYNAEKAQRYEERKREYEREKEEAKERKKKAAEKKSGSTPASNTRGSTPLAPPAGTFTLPDLSKPPPAPPTSSKTGSIPVNHITSGSTPLDRAAPSTTRLTVKGAPGNQSVQLVKKKIPGLFDIKFPDQMKPRFPIIIPKKSSVKPVTNFVPPTTYPNRFTRPPPPPLTL